MKQILPYKEDKLLAFAEYGQPGGYPILVQHGLIASIDDSALFERLLSLPVRLVCIARPGYGDSSPYEMQSYSEWADIVSILIDRLTFSEFDVLAFSSGAPYGYALAARFPRQVRNVFVLSGMPALFDPQVASAWPYPLEPHASIPEMQKLARQLFFSDLSPADIHNPDIRDSMSHDCFGVAQDLRLRAVPWGFDLSSVTQPVYMQHSRLDTNVPCCTAEWTAQLLPRCRLHIKESSEHFSQALLDDFVQEFIIGEFPA